MAERITPEVMVALAAGHLRPSVAKDLRTRIAADSELGETYAGIAAMVQDAGPEGAMEMLGQAWDAHAERNLGIQRPAADGPTGEEPRKGIVRRLWPYATALAACLLIVLYVFQTRVGKEPGDLALAVLSQPPAIPVSRGGGTPDWSAAYERRDYADLMARLRATPSPLTPRERLLLGYCFLKLDPPQPDSARYHIEQVAAIEGLFKDEALLYAGSLALQAGDTATSIKRLESCGDHRAEAILRGLKRK